MTKFVMQAAIAATVGAGYLALEAALSPAAMALSFGFSFTNTAYNSENVTGIVRGLTEGTSSATSVEILSNTGGFGLGEYVGNPPPGAEFYRNTWSVRNGMVNAVDFLSFGGDDFTPVANSSLALGPFFPPEGGGLPFAAAGLSPFEFGLTSRPDAGLTFTPIADSSDNPIDFNSNPIDFTFEETAGEIEIKSPPVQTPLAGGFSIDGLSYLLTSQSTAPISFSWNASRDFNLSGGGDIFASILGNTDLQLTGGLLASLEFFVEGYIDNEASPFARFSIDNPDLVSGVEFPLDWDKTGIVTGLTAGSHTLGIVSGIQWTPSAAGETLFISSQYGGRATPVPTPALLPGLIGMGVAAFRKRKRQDENLNDSV
ncbi:MAG: PTPA-CTERM sorting domain-containing protein [Nodosilinea sp.]